MTERQRTRRRFVAGVTAVGVAGIAGCISTTDESGDDTSPADPSQVPTDSTATETLPAPMLGDPSASVTVMAFEDYACPHCRDYSLNVFPAIRSQYVDTDQIRYEFRDFPIPVSPESSRAASAARAVQDSVGDKAYFTYSKGLFENQRDLGLDTYESLATDIAGADPAAVRAAAAETRYSATVQADRDRGTEIGISGTPGIVVNGTVVSDAASVENISAAIEDAR